MWVTLIWLFLSLGLHHLLTQILVYCSHKCCATYSLWFNSGEFIGRSLSLVSWCIHQASQSVKFQYIACRNSSADGRICSHPWKHTTHFRNVPHLLLSSYPSDIGHMDTAKMVAMDIMPPLLYLLRLLRLFFARNNQLCDETTEQFACSICLRENVQSVIFWILTLAAPTFVCSPFTSTGAHHFHRPCRRISRPLLSFVLVVWGTHTFPSALHSVKSGAIHPCD